MTVVSASTSSTVAVVTKASRTPDDNGAIRSTTSPGNCARAAVGNRQGNTPAPVRSTSSVLRNLTGPLMSGGLVYSAGHVRSSRRRIDDQPDAAVPCSVLMGWSAQWRGVVEHHM
ncbi:hypothetical protein [Streptomyces sp. NPDC002225]|uniref:hypothetical protein n=1 Tax=Streptomyces sp. NPDC002225 TaxID=3154413 RepID=UPI00331DBD34